MTESHFNYLQSLPYTISLPWLNEEELEMELGGVEDEDEYLVERLNDLRIDEEEEMKKNEEEEFQEERGEDNGPGFYSISSFLLLFIIVSIF